MSYALSSSQLVGMANEDRTQFCHPEICEETGMRLFRAGEYVAPGAYMEIETMRCITLVAPDFLPARLDGHVARYRLTRHGCGETPEQTLVQRQAQFQVLVARTRQRLYRSALRALGNPQDAEDVTQEALARAWTHFEAFDPQRSFEAWVSRIVRNLTIDQSRQRRRRQEVSLDESTPCLSGNEEMRPPEFSDSNGDPQVCLMAREISAELQSALGSLSPPHQAILMLVAQQHSYGQIARSLDCPVGTVRSRVHRARVLLRRNLNMRMPHE